MIPTYPIRVRVRGVGQGEGQRGSHGLVVCKPACPTSTSCVNLRAAAPERVKIAVPLPYGLALMRAMASSRVSAWSTCSTGRVRVRVGVRLRHVRVRVGVS